MKTVLDTELNTYQQNRNHLLATAEDKYVLVHADIVVGTYETQMDAVAQGYERFGNVPFLVKHIVRVETPVQLTSALFEF